VILISLEIDALGSVTTKSRRSGFVRQPRVKGSADTSVGSRCPRLEADVEAAGGSGGKPAQRPDGAAVLQMRGIGNGGK
jgi:hypothetical protein